ncbi:phage tail tube protein [Rhodococcus sp. NPDC056506]|uniref:phage tail tube protein n=1 Tax=Rhodococcus sp. NPDC056506 TaxID=3345844 RepID=UPI00366E13F3
MTAPLLPPDTSVLDTALARDWAVQVKGDGGDWVFVNALSQFAPSSDKTLQDDGDIGMKGGKSSLATAIGSNIEITGLRKGTYADTDFEPDEGQEILRAKGDEIGYLAIADIRYWRTDGLKDAFQGRYTVDWKDGTEDKEGLLSFTVTLTGRGRRTKIAKPTAGNP